MGISVRCRHSHSRTTSFCLETQYTVPSTTILKSWHGTASLSIRYQVRVYLGRKRIAFCINTSILVIDDSVVRLTTSGGSSRHNMESQSDPFPSTQEEWSQHVGIHLLRPNKVQLVPNAIIRRMGLQSYTYLPVTRKWRFWYCFPWYMEYSLSHCILELG